MDLVFQMIVKLVGIYFLARQVDFGVFVEAVFNNCSTENVDFRYIEALDVIFAEISKTVGNYLQDAFWTL